MPNNTRLLKKQRPTVEAWASSRQGKIIKVIDRSCNYRDTIVEWQQSIIQGNGEKEATIFYKTLLELTPTGKIRREQTERVKVIYRDCISFPTWLQLTLPIPQAQFLPPPPPTIQRKYLYPRDKSKRKQKKIKTHQQQTLPLFGAAAKLQAYVLRRGEMPQSSESLLEGKGVYYSLDGEKIPVPEAILKLIAEYKCSADETEIIINLARVLNPKDLLDFIEQIPEMRAISNGFPDFVERNAEEPIHVLTSVPVSVSNSC